MPVKLNTLGTLQQRSLNPNPLEPAYPVNERQINNPQDGAVEDADEDCGTDGDCEEQNQIELD